MINILVNSSTNYHYIFVKVYQILEKLPSNLITHTLDLSTFNSYYKVFDKYELLDTDYDMEIISFVPLVIKIENNLFVRFRWIEIEDFHLINYSLNMYDEDSSFCRGILENYFLRSKDVKISSAFVDNNY